jgi:hypothetical protein
MSSDSFQPPLQLKGEIMDLEFTVDTDHRKRRRNRTTQSCLNCHTSKRKVRRSIAFLLVLTPRISVIENVLANAASNLVWYVVYFLLPWWRVRLDMASQTGLCVYEIDDPALRCATLAVQDL